jgi:hypothetical protein
VHARLTHEVPERNPPEQVWPQLTNPRHVKPYQNVNHGKTRTTISPSLIH